MAVWCLFLSLPVCSFNRYGNLYPTVLCQCKLLANPFITNQGLNKLTRTLLQLPTRYRKEKKQVQKASVEKTAPAKQDEQSAPAVSSDATGRTQIQEKPLSSSKPPGSRLAICFNGP